MPKLRQWICYVVIALNMLLIAGCHNPSIRSSVIINGQEFIVETVCSKAAVEQGLSGRTSLPEGTGMLFIFDHPDYYSIWMKEMKFSIDILWINEFRDVVHIETNVSPKSYPKTFISSVPALYVLEIPSGASADIPLPATAHLKNTSPDDMPCR